MIHEIYIIIILLLIVWIIWLGNRPVRHQFNIDDFLRMKKQFDGDTQKYKEDIATFGFKSLEVVYEQQTFGNPRAKKITLKKD